MRVELDGPRDLYVAGTGATELRVRNDGEGYVVRTSDGWRRLYLTEPSGSDGGGARGDSSGGGGAGRDAPRRLMFQRDGRLPRAVRDPRAAVTMALPNGDIGAHQELLDRLAQLADHGEPPTTGLDACQRLVCATWPLLATLHRFGPVRTPRRVPSALVDVLARAAPADAVEVLLAHGRRHRPTERLLGRLLGTEGLGGMATVALLRAARGLEPDHVITIADKVDHHPVRPLLPAAEAVAAAQLLAGSHKRHMAVLATALVDRTGPEVLRTLGQAAALGPVDLTGVEDARHARVRALAALAEPTRGHGLERLQGMHVAGTDLHLRVARPGDDGELGHAGDVMANCLDTEYVGGGSWTALLLAVDDHGRYRHAIEVHDRQVVQWAGPGNTVPAEQDIGQLRELLTGIGLCIPRRVPRAVPF